MPPVALAAPPRPSPTWPLAAPRHPAGIAAIAGAHILAVWALLQGDLVLRTVQQVRPLMVALIDTPAPPRPADPNPPVLPAPPARPTPSLPAPALLPPPEVSVATAPAAPPPAAVVTAQPPAQPLATAPAPAAPPADPAPARPAQATSPPAPAAPPVLPASAIRYRVPPAIEVPMASRRLGESGTVLLRVWVDAQGLPRQVSLQRSSGFARLDEQALAAMRQARFQPVNDGGSAIEWVVIAPLQYEID